MHLAGVELLNAGQLVPQLAVTALDGLHQHQRIQGLIQETASLQITELSIQIGSRDGQVMLALTVVSLSWSSLVSASTR